MIVDDSMTAEDAEEAIKNKTCDLLLRIVFGENSLIHPENNMTKIAFYNKMA